MDSTRETTSACRSTLVDSSSVRAKRGGDLTGPNPTDRGKKGTKYHLAVTRGGNGTLAEAAFHGVPLLMVPLPSAAENHQLHNARAVAAAGAGVAVHRADIAGFEA